MLTITWCRVVCRERMPKVIALPSRSMTLLEELEWYFGSDGYRYQITKESFESLGAYVAKRWICTAAAEDCTGTDVRARPTDVYEPATNLSTSRHHTDPLSDPTVRPSTDTPSAIDSEGPSFAEDPAIDEEVEEGSEPIKLSIEAELAWMGDQVLQNAIRSMVDMSLYLEFNQAIADGDIGRAFEIIKVRVLSWP